MDRWRAAGALLALAACIACSAAAPTASNHTALDLYDGVADGCYYNFQHYGEGDRIMTNEPCLNCTCHNRMLMCYLRVCPFTKPIGQDCTVEKRADQCCPIVTCPDVPVDLLTSTSTSSPAEYGATGMSKLDKYGCSINGKYFSEGSKVPPTPNKPCEHCYCIRNMTTCVMQECTLHVDGCTPIYHKDVCCPVRYSCDHQEDEILLLDDMTTTVRPTPGFLLTTTTTTVAPVTQMTQDCVYNGKIYPDGGHIKTENACDHCYCMKGDIVCVVQECGTPMENEGKNCSSLLPREGQCCPDTYICEGDELSTEVAPEITTEQIQEEQPTLLPPRRTGVEGSGYRNEPDESPYTETPILEPEVEGSGEEQPLTPTQSTSGMLIPEHKPGLTDEILETTEDANEYISITTKKSVVEESGTTPAYAQGEQAEITEILTEETSEPHDFIPYTTNVPTSEEDERVTTEQSKEEDLISDAITEKEMSDPHPFDPFTSILPTFEEVESATTKSKEQEQEDQVFATVGTSEEKTSEVHPFTTSAPIIEVETEIASVESVERDTVTDRITDDETSERQEHILSTTNAPSAAQDETSTPLRDKTEPEKHEIVTEEIEKESITIDPLEQHIVTDGISEEEGSKSHLYKHTTSSPAVGEEQKATTELEETRPEGQDIITGEVAETESVEPHQYIPTTTITSIFEDSGSVNTELYKEQNVVSGITEESLEPQQHIPTATMSVIEESDQTTSVVDEEKEIISSSTLDPHRYIPSATNAPEIEENLRETTETSKEQDLASGGPTSVEGSESYQYIPSTTSSPNLDDSKEESTETSKVQDIDIVESDIQKIPESHQYVPSTTPEDSIRETTEQHKEQEFVSDVTTEEESSTSHKYKPSTSVPASEEMTETNISQDASLGESSKPHDYIPSTPTPSLEDSEKATTNEPDKGLNTIPSGVVEEESSESSISEKATIPEETSATEATVLVDDKQTYDIESMTTVVSEFPSLPSESYVSKDDQYTVTTEPTFRKEDDSEIQPVTHKAPELTTVSHTQTGSTETIAPSVEQETKETTIPLPEHTHEADQTMISKEPTSESFLETSTSAESTDKELLPSPVTENEGVTTTPALEKVDLPETTTINLGENEIHEDSILTPGRIPGEGDCLLDGVTYRNDSIVPSSNKCHTDCTCISSIIKCNPIICSPPPDYMSNCQSTYDSPESCCPTYICDHSGETMPPQSHSQMSGTETPVQSPTIECHGDECQVSKDKKQPTESSDSCTTGNCLSESSVTPELHPQGIPEHHKDCTDGKCTHVESCANGDCQPPPIQDLLCNEENGCQVSPIKPCDGEGCQVTPEDAVAQTPQLCDNVKDCKDLKVSETPIKQTQEDIEQECTEKSCKKKHTPDVEETLPIQCTGSDCLQQIPDISESATDTQLSTESTLQDHTPREELEQKDNILTTVPDLHDIKLADTIAPEEDITEKHDTSSISPEYAYTDTSEIVPGITEILEEYDLETKAPDNSLVLTEIPELHEIATKEQTTESKNTAPNASESKTSAVQPEMTTELAQSSSSVKESVLIEEHVTEYHEPSSTEYPEISVTEIEDEQTKIPKITIDKKQELETNKPTLEEIQTESPNIDATKAQEDSTKIDHVESETEVSDSYVTKEEYTEGPQITEAQVVHTTEPEVPVKDNYDVSSKSPEQEESYTESPQETKSPEIMEVEKQEHDRSTESSELPDMELDQETRGPESTTAETQEIYTKSPNKETSQEFVTESHLPDEISSSTQEHTKSEPSESTVPYLKPEVTPMTTELEDIDNVITEASIEEEMSTKASLPDVTISNEETSHTPAKEEEKKIVSESNHVTIPEVAVTNKDEEIIKDQTTTAPKTSVAEEEAKSTMTPEIIDSDKHHVILPEPHVTEIVGMLPEATEPTILGQEEISTEYGPESQVTELHDLSQPQEETSSKVPATITTTSERDSSPTAVVSISDERISTESSVSEVTQKVDERVPTTSTAIAENEESKTVIPDIYATEQLIEFTEKPYDSEDKKDKTELPELYIPETEQLATEGPVEQINENEIKTERPEVIAPGVEGTAVSERTESPLILEEENEKKHPEKATEQVPLVDEIGPFTGKPVTSSDEKELSVHELTKPTTEFDESNTETSHIITQEVASTEHQEFSTETPMTYKTESSEPYIPVHKETYTGKPTVDDSKLPEYPENVPEEPLLVVTEDNEISTEPIAVEETYTHVPEHIPTESQDSESKAPDHIIKEESSNTKVPTSYESENEIEGATLSVTKGHETYTVSPDVPATDEEIHTEMPESFDTESHRISTNVPIVEISDEDQKTPENLGTDVVTKEPEVYATEKLEATTNTPIILITTPREGDSDYSVTQEKEMEIPVSSQTELPEISTKLTELVVTEQEKFTTELPESETKTQQTKVTESPEIFTKDHTIEDIQKLSTEMPSATEETHKEMPTITETSTESQFVQTPEPSTEQQEIDITEMAEVHVTEQIKIQTDQPLSMVTESVEASTKLPEGDDAIKYDVGAHEPNKALEEQEPSQETYTSPHEIVTEITVSTEASTKLAELPTHKPELEPTVSSESEQTFTPHPIELEEYTHKIKEYSSTASPTDTERTTINLEITDTHASVATTEKVIDDILETATKESDIPIQTNEETVTLPKETSEAEVYQTPSPESEEVSEITTQSSILINEPTLASPGVQNTESKYTIVDQNKDISTSAPSQPSEDDQSVSTVLPDGDKPPLPDEGTKVQAENVPPVTEKPAPVEISFETIAPEEEFILATTKSTTSKFEEEVSTQSPSVDKFTKPKETPEETKPATAAPELSKPGPSEIQPTDEVPTPEEEGHFPTSEVSGYGPEPDYVEEDQAFGPGTCRYGGKVYVSAQQIPRDDPCDFCFCFRSDIICLQQSCPPPIHGCHEEPIQGFCCPRYECPVSMATTLNVTTTTTTTTTTLPPHFPTHPYKGAAQRRGCQIKGHTYKVGEVVRSSSGPCLHCTCGGDGQMKCDPKACTPEPMLRQMIAAAVSAKRRR